MTGSTIAKFLATPILALSVIVASMSASTQPAEAGIKKELVVAAAVVGDSSSSPAPSSAAPAGITTTEIGDQRHQLRPVRWIPMIRPTGRAASRSFEFRFTFD